MSSEVPKSSRRPEERWAAIKRTQRKMAPPPGGEDIGALLAKSMDAYWAAREQAVADEIGDGSEAFVRAAAWFRKESFQKEFLSDFVCAFTPAALVLLTYIGMWRADFILPDWLPWAATGFALLVFVGAWLRRRSSPLLRYSIGALAAGLLVSIGFGNYLFRQAEANNSIALVAMRGEVEEVAISSLLGRLEEGKDWLTPQIQGDVVSLQSNPSANGVVYKAYTHRFPGELVARLGPTSGEVRWISPNQNSLQTALAAGRLLSADESGNWQFEANSHDAALELWADPKLVGIQPKPGECLIVVYQPTHPRNKVGRAVRLDSCRSLLEGEAAQGTAGQLKTTASRDTSPP